MYKQTGIGMKEKQNKHQMTPFPSWEKRVISKRDNKPELYSKNGRSALRKLKFSTNKNESSFLAHKILRKRSNGDLSSLVTGLNLISDKCRVMSTEVSRSNLNEKSLDKPSFFLRNNSNTQLTSDLKDPKKSNSDGISFFERTSNHSLYKFGQKRFLKKNEVEFSLRYTQENKKKSLSPKLPQLNMNNGINKFTKKLERHCVNKTSNFVKELDSSQQKRKIMYKKPKLQLVQRAGQAKLGIKSFPHNNLLKKKGLQSRNSIKTDTQNTLDLQKKNIDKPNKQLEKVRVFDINSKWFKAKKQLNYSEKVEANSSKIKISSRSLKNKNKQCVNAVSERKFVTGLKNKIVFDQKKKSDSTKHLYKAPTRVEKKIDLYSNWKRSQQVSRDSPKSNDSFRLSNAIYW